jgi:hypothetical protein
MLVVTTRALRVPASGPPNTHPPNMPPTKQNERKNTVSV